MSQGLKHDNGKLRWDLLPLPLIEKVVEVYTFGAQKYEDNSWQNLENGRERYYAALLRHLCAWRKGEVIDEDSKLSSMAHVAWNAIALMHFESIEHPKEIIEHQNDDNREWKFSIGEKVYLANHIPINDTVKAKDVREKQGKLVNAYYLPAHGWVTEEEIKKYQ